MEANLRDESFGGRVLPGVPELLGDLEEAGHTLGLLTGNIERGGLIKVAHYGLAEYFQFGSYGDDHWDRNKLGSIAIQRANKHTGKSFTARDVIVILRLYTSDPADTPLVVDLCSPGSPHT